jgi:hypothetical protein
VNGPAKGPGGSGVAPARRRLPHLLVRVGDDGAVRSHLHSGATDSRDPVAVAPAPVG